MASRKSSRPVKPRVFPSMQAPPSPKRRAVKRKPSENGDKPKEKKHKHDELDEKHVGDDEKEKKHEGKEEKKEHKKDKHKKHKHKKDIPTAAPRMFVKDAVPGEIIGQMTYMLVKSARKGNGGHGIEDQDRMEYMPLRERGATAWYIRANEKTPLSSTRRYGTTVELRKTKLADKFITCTTYPVRVSFMPILSADKLGEKLDEHQSDIALAAAGESKKIAKKIMNLDVRTMVCVIKTANSSLGYSLVDEFTVDGDTANPNPKTVSHHALQQFLYHGVLYKLKGSKFVDPELIAYSV